MQMFADAARTKRYTLNPDDQSLQTHDNAEELTHKLVAIDLQAWA